MVKTPPFYSGAGVRSLVWELRSHMAQGTGKNKKMKNMQSFEKDMISYFFSLPNKTLSKESKVKHRMIPFKKKKRTNRFYFVLNKCWKN